MTPGELISCIGILLSVAVFGQIEIIMLKLKLQLVERKK
jgi:hypothetical protein